MSKNINKITDEDGNEVDDEDNILEYDQIIEFEPIFEARARQPFAYIYPIYNHGQARSNEVVYAYWSADAHFLVHQSGRNESVNELSNSN